MASVGAYVMRYGSPITNEEAINILNRAEEAGFILQPQKAQEPQFICL